MKTIEKTTKIWIANDGREFLDGNECAAHETELERIVKQVSYWTIWHSPDTTEGRGFNACFEAKVTIDETWPEPTEIYIQDYCERKYGAILTYVMGVQSTKAWSFAKSTKEQYCHNLGLTNNRSPTVELNYVQGKGLVLA